MMWWWWFSSCKQKRLLFHLLKFAVELNEFEIHLQSHNSLVRCYIIYVLIKNMRLVHWQRIFFQFLLWSWAQLNPEFSFNFHFFFLLHHKRYFFNIRKKSTREKYSQLSFFSIQKEEKKISRIYSIQAKKKQHQQNIFFKIKLLNAKKIILSFHV
jgi:hypothetical protein